jgi:hypothetical protein
MKRQWDVIWAERLTGTLKDSEEGGGLDSVAARTEGHGYVAWRARHSAQVGWRLPSSMSIISADGRRTTGDGP